MHPDDVNTLKDGDKVYIDGNGWKIFSNYNHDQSLAWCYEEEDYEDPSATGKYYDLSLISDIED